MRCVIVNTAASSGGALSILKDFYKYLKENDFENEWIFLLSDNYLKSTDNIKIVVLNNIKNKISRLKFDNIDGKKIIDKFKPDIVFSMQNTTISGLKVPQCLYLHQAIPFQNIKKFSFLNKEEFMYANIQYILGRSIKKGLYRANKIIVQTEWMKKAIVEQTNYKSYNIEVISPSIDVGEKYKNKRTITNRFIYPTSNILYKNNKLIDKACELITEQYPNLEFDVEITIDENFKNKKIKSIGKVTRDEVLNKLSNRVLLFPSYIETFGLPLAEARELNSIIFASDTEFAREVLRGYTNAFFFDPFNEKELARLMLESIKGNLTQSNLELPKEVNSWKNVREMLLRQSRELA